MGNPVFCKRPSFNNPKAWASVQLLLGALSVSFIPTLTVLWLACTNLGGSPTRSYGLCYVLDTQWPALGADTQRLRHRRERWHRSFA